MNYVKFAVMIITSTVAMFVMMYLNTYAISHIWFRETRTYMQLYMGAGMAIIMLAFMWGMYTKKRLNITILVGAGGLFFACYTLFVLKQLFQIQLT